MSNITHLPSHASDHLPIILQFQCYQLQRRRREKGFKFEESWLLWEECENVVMDAWKNVGDDVTRLSSIKEKKCGEELMTWGWLELNQKLMLSNSSNIGLTF